MAPPSDDPAAPLPRPTPRWASIGCRMCGMLRQRMGSFHSFQASWYAPETRPARSGAATAERGAAGRPYDWRQPGTMATRSAGTRGAAGDRQRGRNRPLMRPTRTAAPERPRESAETAQCRRWASAAARSCPPSPTHCQTLRSPLEAPAIIGRTINRKAIKKD